MRKRRVQRLRARQEVIQQAQGQVCVCVCSFACVSYLMLLRLPNGENLELGGGTARRI